MFLQETGHAANAGISRMVSWGTTRWSPEGTWRPRPPQGPKRRKRLPARCRKGLPLSSRSKQMANGCRGKPPKTLEGGRRVRPERGATKMRCACAAKESSCRRGAKMGDAVHEVRAVGGPCAAVHEVRPERGEGYQHVCCERKFLVDEARNGTRIP